MRKKLFILLFLPVLLFSFFAVLPPHAQAQTTQDWSGVCVGSEDSSNNAYQVATIQGFQCLIANVLSIAVSAIGLAGFVMLIFGSFKILLGGNSKGIEEGRNTITLAIVGLIVALSAWFILNIIASFTGVNAIKNFRISNSTKTFTTP